MGTYNLIASSNKDTVVTEYVPVKTRAKPH